jgi:hypothetical protein
VYSSLCSAVANASFCTVLPPVVSGGVAKADEFHSSWHNVCTFLLAEIYAWTHNPASSTNMGKLAFVIFISLQRHCYKELYLRNFDDTVVRNENYNSRKYHLADL